MPVFVFSTQKTLKKFARCARGVIVITSTLNLHEKLENFSKKSLKIVKNANFRVYLLQKFVCPTDDFLGTDAYAHDLNFTKGLKPSVPKLLQRSFIKCKFGSKTLIKGGLMESAHGSLCFLLR